MEAHHRAIAGRIQPDFAPRGPGAFGLPPGASLPYLGAVNLRAISFRAGGTFLLLAVLLGLARWMLRPPADDADPAARGPAGAPAAYAAVAADDKANAGRPPQALVLPLRPGPPPEAGSRVDDSRSAGILLLNDRIDGQALCSEYASLNQGVASDEQLDGLLALGARHLLFHSDAYAEDVSPFPAAAALRALVGHPRLALIADDGQIFAFRILPKHPVEHAPHANWPDTLFAASRHWHWDPPLEIPQGESAPLFLSAPAHPAPGLRILLRIAEGSAQPLLTPPSRKGISSITHPVAGCPDWLQADLPSSTGAFVHALSGPVLLEHALLAAGELPAPGRDGSIHVPPALLYHRGHSSPGAAQAYFLPETVPAGLVLHGPDLPFPPGVYDVSIAYSADVPAGTLRLLELPGRTVLAAAELAVDEKAFHAHGETLRFPAIPIGAEPLRFELDYNGRANLMLHDIAFRPATLQLRPAHP